MKEICKRGEIVAEAKLEMRGRYKRQTVNRWGLIATPVDRDLD